MDVLEHSGIWWLPEAPDQSVHGTIKFDAEKGAELKLLGSLGADPLNNDFAAPIINGVTETGEVITLYECMFSGGQVTSPGMGTTRLHVNVVLIGHHFTTKEDVVFEKFASSFENLAEWALVSGISTGIKVDESGTKITGFTASRSDIPDYAVELPSAGITRLRFTTTFKTSGDGPGQLRWEERLFIEVQPTEPTQLEDYLERFLYHIRNFLALGVGAPVRLMSMEATPPQAGDDRPTGVKIYYRSGVTRSVRVNRHYMLFSFPEIRENYGNYLSNWFQKAELLKPIYDLYFGTVFASSMYLEHQFLSLAQAIESYHRRTQHGTYLQKGVFRAVLKSLRALLDTLFNIPEHVREVFSGKLAFLNEFTLRTRLSEVLDSLGPAVNLLIEKPEEFVRSVTDTRNYLTHYDEKLRGKSAHGQALYLLIQRLKFVLELSFLRELGMSAETIDALARKHQHYIGVRHTLGTD